MKCPPSIGFVIILIASMTPEKEVELICKLGEGAYGCVFKGRLLANDMIVAVKLIRINSDDEGVSSTTLREITILKKLNHQNIIRSPFPHLGYSASRSTMRPLTPRSS